MSAISRMSAIDSTNPENPRKTVLVNGAMTSSLP
jgi:hypothetical protein